jgi:superfamily II DNA/RNA helicase
VKVGSRQKREVLRHLLRNDNVTTAIIFANRKTTVRELAKSLKSHGFAAGEIHGDMDQSSRIAELDRFKSGDINILCASDVAARGLDIKGVSHVFNFDTPWHPDDYVHRIGRTGRGGATGRAFTLVAPEDAEAIENVEKLTGARFRNQARYRWRSGGGTAGPQAARGKPAAAEKPKRGRKAEPRAPEEEASPARARPPRSEARPRREAPAERAPRYQVPNRRANRARGTGRYRDS